MSTSKPYAYGSSKVGKNESGRDESYLL
ncbi:uncharacterized protein METZ01_LOCUS166693 [marine metagenome]|uniref:Uncharacterized protein n=1 Tax=marine metagenome TaxID=408172 RepID=A0A382BJN7_9ZZZZ